MVKVMAGSLCLVKWLGKVYRGVILDIRPKSRQMLVEFKDKNGKTRKLWRNQKELTTESREDAKLSQVKVLGQ